MTWRPVRMYGYFARRIWYDYDVIWLSVSTFLSLMMIWWYNNDVLWHDIWNGPYTIPKKDSSNIISYHYNYDKDVIWYDAPVFHIIWYGHILLSAWKLSNDWDIVRRDFSQSKLLMFLPSICKSRVFNFHLLTFNNWKLSCTHGN